MRAVARAEGRPAASPHARPRLPAQPPRRSGALSVLLCALLAAFAALTFLPDGLAHVRLAGVSALWWYAGVVGPALAWFGGTVLLPRKPPAAGEGAAER
jgi:hypothetical protein